MAAIQIFKTSIIKGSCRGQETEKGEQRYSRELRASPEEVCRSEARDYVWNSRIFVRLKIRARKRGDRREGRARLKEEGSIQASEA